MTLTKDIIIKRAIVGLPLAGLGIAAMALSGCGGASTGGAAGIATPNSGPVIYGVDALALDIGTQPTGETSGLSFSPATVSNGVTTTTPTRIIIGATAYKTLTGVGPLPVYQGLFPNKGTGSSAGVPLGFGPSGSYYNNKTTALALPTNYAGALTFGAFTSNGAQKGSPVLLNTSSAVLTSTESPSFSQPMTFDPNYGNSFLTYGAYKTAAFPMPAFLTTTGLHNLRASISDVGNPVQSSQTDFSVLSLAPADSAALVQLNYTNADPKDPAGAAVGTVMPIFGATATITNPITTVAAYKDATGATGATGLPLTTSYSDAQGVVILFAPPGAQTVTVNGPNPFNSAQTVTGTITLTLAPGVVNSTGIISATLVPVAATPAAAARAKLMQRPFVKH